LEQQATIDPAALAVLLGGGLGARGCGVEVSETRQFLANMLQAIMSSSPPTGLSSACSRWEWAGGVESCTPYLLPHDYDVYSLMTGLCPRPRTDVCAGSTCVPVMLANAAPPCALFTKTFFES